MKKVNGRGRPKDCLRTDLNEKDLNKTWRKKKDVEDQKKNRLHKKDWKNVKEIRNDNLWRKEINVEEQKKNNNKKIAYKPILQKKIFRKVTKQIEELEKIK